MISIKHPLCEHPRIMCTNVQCTDEMIKELRSMRVVKRDRLNMRQCAKHEVDMDNTIVSEKYLDKFIEVATRYKRVPVVVTCGHCHWCVKRLQNQWITRMRHEAVAPEYVLNRRGKNYTQFATECTYWGTFTIDPHNYPLDDTTNGAKYYYGACVQTFFKRLRKENTFGLKFRYYCVAEYGSDFGRLHFHILFFLPKDFDNVILSLHKKYYKKIKRWNCKVKHNLLQPHRLEGYGKGGHAVAPRMQTDIESKFQDILDYVWHNGFVEKVSKCTVGTFSYITKYVTKEDGVNDDNYKPFHRQSLGLGTWWLEQNKFAIATDNVRKMPFDPHTNNDNGIGISKYYRNKYKQEYGTKLASSLAYIKNSLDICAKQLGYEKVRKYLQNVVRLSERRGREKFDFVDFAEIARESLPQVEYDILRRYDADFFSRLRLSVEDWQRYVAIEFSLPRNFVYGRSEIAPNCEF